MKVKIITHNGGFHSDELFAIALIKKYVTSDITVIRTRDPDDLKKYLYDNKVWVIDVGGQHNDRLKNFDHHQGDFSETWKGTDILFSSCGLVWNYLKKAGYLNGHSRWVQSEIENKLIKKIDLNDNGKCRWPQAIMFKLFNRDRQDDVQFHKALHLAEMHLENSIYFICTDEANRSRVDKHEYVSGGEVVVVEEGGFNVIPILSTMTDARVVVESKASDGAWSVQSIDKGVATPNVWRGLSGERLEDVSGVNGLVFAHRSGHLVKARNKSAAIEVAKIMLGES